MDWEQLIGCWGSSAEEKPPWVRDADAATTCRIVALVWQNFFLVVARDRETERVEEKNVAKERKRERGEDALSGWPGSNSVFIPRTSPGPS